MTYQRFRSTVADNQIVEAVQYLADGSNAAYVRQFLEHHHPSEWPGPHTYMCGPDYRTIGVSIFGNPTFITPGNIAYVDIRTKQVRTMFNKDFLTYYAPVSTPEPDTADYMSAPASYRRQHQDNPVTAIRYAKGRNSTAIMDMLIPYGSLTRFAAHRDTERLSFRPNKAKCRVAGLMHEDADFFLRDGEWITITDRPGSVPLIKLYNDTDFQYLLRPYTPAPAPAPDKETTVPIVSSVQPYTRRHDGASASAIQYQGTYNEKAVRDLLRWYGICNTTDPVTGAIRFSSFRGNVAAPGESGAFTRFILPQEWIIIIKRPNGVPPLFQLADDLQFQNEFISDAVKETMPKEITSYDPDSEYGQNRTAVLDALAVLRTSASDTTFELVTNELMALLSSAFNTGWDEGMEAGQRNPYENLA